MESAMLREKILDLVSTYYCHQFQEQPFCPGETYIPYAGRVFDQEELVFLVDAALDFWLTAGRFTREFESEFSKYLQVRHAVFTTSGSSANLLAVSALTSEKLGERRLKPGDEVITLACGFPTTVAPIYQNRLIPVYCDIDLASYNIQTEQIESSITKKTKAIFLAHTLGNPFNIEALLSIKKKFDLWLIEDNCDALGALWGQKRTGTFGDIATFSFYPPHHITTGEGGMVATNETQLMQIVKSFRDWGRDCWCEPGQDNSCNCRFGMKFGEMPFGYDHKFIYSHIGYNLKATDLQAAVGVAQLKKLDSFIRMRNDNFQFFYQALKKYEEFLVFPKWEEKATPAWFGFPLTVRSQAPFSKNDLVQYLEAEKIATRMLFAGNIMRQPAYFQQPHRVAAGLENTDRALHDTFWIGVYPGIDAPRRDYIVSVFERFFNRL